MPAMDLKEFYILYIVLNSLFYLGFVYYLLDGNFKMFLFQQIFIKKKYSFGGISNWGFEKHMSVSNTRKFCVIFFSWSWTKSKHTRQN
jgi:hypothetical protein